MKDDDKLASLLLQWEEHWDHGEDIPASQLCADCPELTDDLQERIEALKKMDWMKDDEDEDEDQQDQQDPLVSQTLAGRYRIEQQIGEGGFGRVYRAYDPELQRPVAIKVPRPGKLVEQADELLQEARRTARLRHPGIVSVHDVGRNQETAFIVTDYIAGSNLAEVIAHKRPEPKEAVRLIAQVADALQFAHDQGFIHLDIKPANILLDEQGKPLLTDFGIAATIDQVVRGEAGTSGTLPYMAPEQLGNTQSADQRTDIYALGVVLYELLTGILPATPPETTKSTGFTDTDEICRKCLAKNPKERFASAAELASALRSCRMTKRAAPSKRSFTHKSRVFLIALLVFFGSVVLITLVSAPQPQGPPYHVRIGVAKDITNSIGMRLVLIPPGKFLMGSPNDEPGRILEEYQHEVEITRPFYMGVHEVTQAQYETIMGKNPSNFSETGGGKRFVKEMDTTNLPVEMVNWQGAVDFCKKLSEFPEEKENNRVYRLPTEAEWEYACRAGTTTPWHFGSSISPQQARLKIHPVPVGTYAPNQFGLYDMHGNVGEWTADWLDTAYYQKSPRRDPPGPSSYPEKRKRRVLRGGGWHSRPEHTRSAHRDRAGPGLTSNHFGFRVVFTVDTKVRGTVFRQSIR